MNENKNEIKTSESVNNNDRVNNSNALDSFVTTLDNSNISDTSVNKFDSSDNKDISVTNSDSSDNSDTSVNKSDSSDNKDISVTISDSSDNSDTSVNKSDSSDNKDISSTTSDNSVNTDDKAEGIINSEKKTISNNLPRKFDEDFDIFEYVEKHSKKNTSLKKSRLPLVIMIIIITICIITMIVLAVIFSNTGEAEVNDSRIIGSWQREDGDVMNITGDGRLTINGESVEYTLRPDEVIEMTINGEKLRAVYVIDEPFLFIMIPYDNETVTLEYMRKE